MCLNCAFRSAILTNTLFDSAVNLLYQDIWPDLFEDGHESTLIQSFQVVVTELEQQLAHNRAALIHLEAQVIDVACDDRKDGGLFRSQAHVEGTPGEQGMGVPQQRHVAGTATGKPCCCLMLVA